MKLIFDQFKDNLLTVNYSLNFSSSLLTIMLSWTLPEHTLFVSAAKDKKRWHGLAVNLPQETTPR